MINISGNAESFDIADLKNVGGGIKRTEGSGIDSYATTCSIRTMLSAGDEYLDYDYDKYKEVKNKKESYKNIPQKGSINEIIRKETRLNGLLILYPIGDAGELTAKRGDHKPPFGFAAVFPDRQGKGNLKSYRMNEIAVEKDSDEFYN